MSRSSRTFIQLSAVVLALGTTPKFLVTSIATLSRGGETTSEIQQVSPPQWLTWGDPVLAQTPENKQFPIPDSLPADARVKIDGTSSMSIINQALQQQFSEKFPNAQVEAVSQEDSQGAIEELLKGNIDIAAVGRPLTDAQKAQGLEAVPVDRGKIAIIISPNNPFAGNISFEQFARMFRGEITNWSDVGGEPAPIKFVDRPESSDTRRALAGYKVFEGTPFQSGSNTTRAKQDNTEAVIQELGENGIGYAIADQVLDQDNVRIIAMHQTLPDDARYPYSQYRSYIYNSKTANPATLAFLGIATSDAGTAAIRTATAAKIGSVAVAPRTTPSPTVSPAATAPATPPAVEATPAATPEVPATEITQGTETEAAPALARDRGAAGRFPWWLLWLLGLPLLGAGLWWLLRGQDEDGAIERPGRSPVEAETVARPQSPAPAPAPQVEVDQPAITPRIDNYPNPDISNVSGAGSNISSDTSIAPPAPSLPVENLSPGVLDIPTTGTPGVGLSGTSGVTAGIPTVDSGIPGSIGLPGVAGVTGLAGAAGLAAWALRDRTSRLTIAPGRNQTLESYWTVTDADQRAAREQGGRDFQMRVYDVTDIDFNTQSAHSMQFYDLDVLDRQGQVAIPDPNRDYLAEVGYVSETGTWLPLARSNSIRASVQESISVPPTPPAEIEAEGTGVGATTVALVGGSGIAAGGTLVGSALDAGLVGATTEAPLLTHDLAGEDCWMTLRTQGEQSVSARWHLPQSQRENARQQGGQQLQLRVYDIDHVDVDIQAPNSVQVYDCDEFNDDVDQEWQVPVPHRDHYYIAEIGYNTLEQEWMPLARSNSVRVPELSSTTAGSSKIAQSAMVGAGAVMAATAPLGRLGVSNQSRVTIMPQSGSEAMVASWQIATNEQATAQQQGGQQFQLRIHDVTGVDPETQPAHSIHVYDCDRAMGELQVSAPVSDRDYVAEVGYLTPDQRWIQLAYSQSMRIPPTAESTTPVALGGVGLGMVGVATGVATATAAIPDAWSEGSSPGVAIRPDIPDQGTSRDGCKIEHLTVSSQNNCYILNPDQVRNLQETAISKTLEPGIYLIRIKAGNFGYTSGQGYTGEPVVLVWINGGRVMNQKTNMPVPATWSSLNGYSETLTLKVLETTTLYTFFIDTYREDNSGEITLSVARLYPNN